MCQETCWDPGERWAEGEEGLHQKHTEIISLTPRSIKSKCEGLLCNCQHRAKPTLQNRSNKALLKANQLKRV